MNILGETRGMARGNWENLSVERSNKWKIITIFHRPSSIRNTVSIPEAAISGVTSSSLPVGEYLTFLLVLATSVVWASHGAHCNCNCIWKGGADGQHPRT